MAISGRWRFGGLRAAIVASASSSAIGGGGAPTAGAGGSESIQAPPIARRSAPAPKPLSMRSRMFMATREAQLGSGARDKAGVEDHLPQMLVGILEVARVAAPE